MPRSSRFRHFHRQYHAPGTAPGHYDVERLKNIGPPQVTVTDFGADDVKVSGNVDFNILAPPVGGTMRWVSIVGSPTVSLLDQLRTKFDIDPLALEDVVNQGQRPTFDHYGNCLFVVLILPDVDPARRRQLSIFVSDHVLVSFIAADDGVFRPIQDRLGNSNSSLRTHDTFYLLYAILDLSIDMYFPVLDDRATRLTDLEDEVIGDPRQQTLSEVHRIRNDLMLLRRDAWATREVLNRLTHHLDELPEDQHYIRPYLQDCHDHVMAVIDLTENYREIASNLVEIYLSAVSNRMNDVMKVLAVIATIFIPPTFVVGVYGMNFNPKAGPLSMPELDSPYGYVAVMTFILVMIVGLVVYFRRKGWF
ncbi:MAG: magnesium/cobalt transporter CorA [Pseudomonadales bacterium]|nr:magnesium/cobalt transporter CorA [Pseudomonadales bacterium]